MSISAFRYCLVISTILTIAVPVSCHECISCRCGNSNKNYTQCIEKELKEEYTCKRWAKCQTCKENTSHCITCPQKQFGPLCTESVLENIRRKRQDDTHKLSPHCINDAYIHNGRVLVFHIRKQQGPYEDDDFELPVGTRLRYSCDEGYVLKGVAELICEVNGYWSEEKQPICVEATPEVFCNFPEVDVKGMIVEPNDREKNFPVGSDIKFDCEEGYELEGNNWIIYCKRDGKWTAEPPKCTRIPTSDGILEIIRRKRKATPEVFCKFPEVDVKGMIVEPNDREKNFPVGSDIKFDCEEGYELDRNNWIIYCKRDGNWTAEPPKCTRIPTSDATTTYCNHPGVLANGEINDDNVLTTVGQRLVYRPGAELNYRCKDGYEMEGSSNLICTLDGVWSYDPPTCRTGSCRQVCKPVDCEEILIRGNNKSGVYTIWPRSRVIEDKPVEVYCDMLTDGGGWTVIQRRGNFNRPIDYFYKNWTDYKKGFGSLEKDFWLGNNNIFALTSQRLNSIRFDLKAVDGEKRYALYDEFWIDDEDHKYTLHIKDYSGDAGDSMIKVQDNMKFSTKDQKNDVNPKTHCAQVFKGAWWYNDCHEANLNGLYLAGKHDSFADGINWLTFRGFKESLDSTEMKIRSKNFKKNIASRENSGCR